MAEPTSPKAPETPKTTPSVAPETKITLDTKDKLTDLKEKLEVGNVVDPKKKKEIEEIETRFNADKDKILTISRKSLDALKADIDDPNETIDGKILDVKDGELIFEAKADAEPAKPETPIDKKMKELILVDMTGPLPDETKKNIDELKTQDKPRWYNLVEMLSKIPFIGSFFAGFLGLSEGEKPQDIDRDITMIGTILIKASGNTTLMERLTKGMFTEKKSLISAIKSQPELLRGPNIDPKKLQIYLTHVLQQEPITGGDIYGFLVGQITSYPASEVNLNGYTENVSVDTPTNSVLPISILAPNSPEGQKNLMTQAIELDKAKNIPEGTNEEKKAKEEVVKKVIEFKEARQKTILEQYHDLQKRLEEKRVSQKTLVAGNPLDGSDEKKELDVVNLEIKKLEDVQTKMETEINIVMSKKEDLWEIKPGTNCEAMVATEIAISKIESKTSTVDNSTEKSEELKNYEKILDNDKIASDDKIKEIKAYLEKYPNPKLQEKFEVMNSKIALVKLTIEKKNEMKIKDRFINWNNTDEDSRGGWVEIEDEHSGGSYLEEKSWLELDADGFGEVDWQLVRGDNYHVKKVGGLFNARKILNNNKDIVRISDDSENLKI